MNKFLVATTMALIVVQIVRIILLIKEIREDAL